jgi:hypothetical protein
MLKKEKKQPIRHLSPVNECMKAIKHERLQLTNLFFRIQSVMLISNQNLMIFCKYSP